MVFLPNDIPQNTTLDIPNANKPDRLLVNNNVTNNKIKIKILKIDFKLKILNFKFSKFDIGIKIKLTRYAASQLGWPIVA